MIAEKDRPTPEQVEAMFDTNKDGFGIALRIQDGFKNGVGVAKDKKIAINPRVKWEKGLYDLAACQKLIAEAPLPFVAHFRIQTVGGKRASLCHPFPILKDVPLAVKGEIDGFVLFHNGHWGKWRESCLESVWKTGKQLPQGKWSDSRAMAWSAAHFGISILEFIDEKSVAFGYNQCELSGSGWVLEEGVWYSNMNWKSRVKRSSAQDWKPTGARGNFPLVVDDRFYHDIEEASRVATPSSWQPHGHKHYMEQLCVYGPCVEFRVPGSRWCRDHQVEDKSKSTPVINAKIIEADADAGAVKLLEEGKVKIVEIIPNVDSAKGGGTTEESPFDVLDQMKLDGRVSNTQYKKQRKFLEKKFGKPHPKVREKQRYRMPAPLTSQTVH